MLTPFDHTLELFVLTVGLLLIAIEVGWRCGLRTGVYADEARREQVVATRDGILVLLSLLLGFNLALAEPRFERRRDLVVKEANAIGTAELRGQMLPPTVGSEVHKLLITYVEARLDFYSAGADATKLEDANRRTAALQKQLWLQATVAARSTPTPITSLFASSVNEVIDLSAERQEALENRVPQSVWIMLSCIALLACFCVGFSMRRRFLFAMVVTPLMIAVVFSLTADLDAPRFGFIRISQSSLQRLRADLQSSSQN